MPGTRRKTDTTTVVSSKTLPVAGIGLLAAFRDDPLQFGAFRFRQDSGAPFNHRQALRPAGLTQSMDVVGGFFQLGSGKGLQIFHDDFQRAHLDKLNPVAVSDKPLSDEPVPCMPLTQSGKFR